MRAPMLFASDYKHFYCQYNEPFYVKKLKLEMLTAVANESNTYEIGKWRLNSADVYMCILINCGDRFEFMLLVTELCEYAANVDIPIARESIRAVGKIALQQYDVNAIVDRLLQFLEMEKDYVTAETLVCEFNSSCLMLVIMLMLMLNFLFRFLLKICCENTHNGVMIALL